MAAEFSVRINRRDGVLEIEGPDKDWIADQLEKLAVVYEDAPGDSPPAGAGSGNGAAVNGTATTTTPANTGSATPKPKRKGGRAQRKSTLEQALTPELRGKLDAYKNERSGAWKTKTAAAAIIATFLMDELSYEGWIDEDDLYTVYSVMGWTADAPSNFRSVLKNAAIRNGYFGGWVNGRVQLTHSGENYGRGGSKD
jgi:hypothetical protein